MSRSWLDRLKPGWLRPILVLHLGQDRIVWALHAAGLKRQVVAKGIWPLAVTSKDIHQVLAALPGLVQQVDATGARVEVIVSSHFTRYAIVPNPDGAANKAELELLCRHAFERTHGEIAAQWDIQLSFSVLGGNGIASALDRGLLEGLQLQLSEAGSLLISVKPSLAYVFNQFHQPEKDGMLVLAEPGRLSLLAWQEHSWSAVQLLPALPDWQIGLDASLARLRLQLDMPDSTPLKVCDMTDEELLPRIVQWHSPLRMNDVMTKEVA